MSPAKFDRFMADVRNGTNFKLARLSHAHYRAFFSAVLPIAAMSKVRGAFMVNDEPASVEDMRLMAPKLSAAECRTALVVFRNLGLLEHDDDLGGEWVHDFEDWNPEPKTDSSNADRQQRYRDRQKASRNGERNGPSVTSRNGEVTPTEEEGEGKRKEEPQAPSAPRSRADGDSPSLVESVVCPECSAAVGERCNATRGGKRTSYHLKRHHLVGELRHITASPVHSARPTPSYSKPAYRQDPELVALQAEHFPDTDYSTLAGIALSLRVRKHPVTPEAIRSLLEGPSDSTEAAA